MSAPRSQHPAASAPRTAAETALLLQLHRDLAGVASFDRVAHVVLRRVVPHFGATRGVVFGRDRACRPYIVSRIGDGAWDLDAVSRILEVTRVTLPPTQLYGLLRERRKPVAVMLLERDEAFRREELRFLLRALEIVDEALDRLAAERASEVQARIDRKISGALRTADLLYQILDGLQLLVRYNHSASILLLDAENRRLLVRAEKIVWQKMKSPHVGREVPLEPVLLDLLNRPGCGFTLADRDGQVAGATHPLAPAAARIPEAAPEALRLLFARLCETCRSGGIGPPEESMLVAPLHFGKRPLGLLKLSNHLGCEFLADDVQLVGPFIEKIGTAIRNADLYERRLEELRAINEIGKLVTQQLPLQETCRRILDIVLEVMNLKVGSIELIDRDEGRLRVLATAGYLPEAHEGLAVGEGVTGEVARTGKPIVANDVRAHPKYVERFPNVRSELAVPIVFEGTCLGVLNVESHTRNRFGPSDVDFLSILADKTATALETLSQREQRRATLQLLHELGMKLAVPDDIVPLLQLTVDLTRKHLSCEVASIFLFEDGVYRRKATSGLPADFLPEEAFRSGEGLTGAAVVLKPDGYPQPVYDNDVEAGDRALPGILDAYRRAVPSKRIAHLIAVPLVENERPIGILRVINRVSRDGRLLPGGFTPSDITILSTIASQVSLAIANARKREHIQKLTGQLEEQVRERTREAQRLATFVENAPLAIFATDADGRLTFINEAGERMFGYQAEELIGRRLDDTGSGLIGEQYGDLEHVVSFMGHWTGEVQCRRSNGTEFPAYLSARRLGDENAVEGFVIFARDMTTMKELERQLLESEGKRAMADLAGGVAHDLNNALGSALPLIQALVEDLEQGRIDREQFLEDLRQIENYTRASIRIFRGMLAMARGNFQIDQEVSVNDQVDTVLNLLNFKLDKAGIEVVRDLEDPLPRTLAHPGRLEQALHNLVLNAIDAMPEGGRLTVRTRRRGDWIVLQVEDTGTGIPKELLDRVQEPFYTSKRHGTGLGLSVVRSIVWEHNGKLTLDSEEGQGTTVTIELPIVRAPAQAGRDANANGDVA